ncbi:MAG TPA: polysaccharide biosynthesis tyrosine autokinase [Chloroflexota bacterium]|nr:polysaccharide biosynthesis tyrosine autokinase [Chloroflexota bacterium]
MNGSGLKLRQHVRQYTRLLIRWSWLIVLCALVGGGSAYYAASKQAPTYSATTLLLVHEKSSSDPYTTILASDQLLQTYLNLMQAPSVVDRAAKSVPGVSAAELSSGLKVSNPGVSTQILQVQVSNTSPTVATKLANAVAKSFIAVHRSFAKSNDVSVFQPAIPPTKPSSPSPRIFGLIGALAGILLAVVIALIMELMDDRVRTAADAERVTGWTPIASLPNRPKDRGLTVPRLERLMSDKFTLLRTRLVFARSTPVSSMVVTSALPGEGKTTVAINLAMSLAAGGKRTLLMDADLRNPAIEERLGLPNEDGLALWLRPDDERGGRALPIVPIPDVPNLFVLTSGPPPDDPTELLGSAKMQRLLESLLPGENGSGALDFVVMDTPAVDLYGDASVLAAYSAGTLVVVNARRSREGALARARSILRQARARVVGIVMNQVPETDSAVDTSDGLRADDEPVLRLAPEPRVLQPRTHQAERISGA